MFIYSTRCDDVTFSGHLRVTQRQKESSWILSTLNFRKVRDTRFSSWKTKLRSGRILRYMACRGIWVGICRWTTGHCFFTSLYYRVYKFVLVCQRGIVHGCLIDSQDDLCLYRVFSHDVTAAILVSQNNETAAILVSQTNPLGVELFSYANAFFCSDKFA